MEHFPSSEYTFKSSDLTCHTLQQVIPYISDNPVEAATTAVTADPTFYDGESGSDSFSLSFNADCQSKEDLAGSYSYTTISATPPVFQPSGRDNSVGV